MFRKKYHRLLCGEFPAWLEKYTELPCMSRLRGVGLLCGTDWTPLYSNRFFYSRFDHSVGAALVTWNFTRDKKQTLASLFHDVSTAAFSHVNDFRKGDALRQEVSEEGTKEILLREEKLLPFLEEDGVALEDVWDYHRYPVCDNEIPGLSADRLEYMFPSSLILRDKCEGHVWSFGEIKKMYADIKILKNERGLDELGFKNAESALLYAEGFLSCSYALQKNENKLALGMLGEIVNCALDEGVFSGDECFSRSEKELISILDSFSKNVSRLDSPGKKHLAALIKTWRTMKRISCGDKAPEPPSAYYCVNLDVKKRYVNPLVETEDGAVRICELNEQAAEAVRGFLSFRDAPFGFVRLRRVCRLRKFP